MVNPVIQGYLENPYLEGDYIGGTAQHSWGLQIQAIIENKIELKGIQTRGVINETNSYGFEIHPQILNHPLSNAMQFIAGLYSQGYYGEQVRAIIEDAYQGGMQVHAFMLKDFYNGIQIKITVDKNTPSGFQVHPQILDETDAKGLQSELFILKDAAKGIETRAMVKDQLKRIGMQIDGYVTGSAKSIGFQVRGQKSFRHTYCTSQGYLQQPYLETPYTAPGICVLGPFEVEAILFKESIHGFEFHSEIMNRLVAVAVQMHSAIHVNTSMENPGFQWLGHKHGFQLQSVLSRKFGMQVFLYLYNNYNLRVMVDFPSRGTTGTNWTSTSVRAGDFSPYNLNTDIVEQRFQTANLVKTFELVCDTEVAGGISVDTAAILNHNLSVNASIIFQGANAPDFSGTIFTTTLSVKRNQDVYYIAETFPTQQFRYWKLSISDQNNNDTSIYIGTIVFGTTYVLHGESFVDLVKKRKIHFSDKVQTEGFTNVSNDRALKKAVSIDFKNLAYNETNYNKLIDVFDLARTSLKCLWIPDSKDPHRFAVFGKLNQMPEETHNNMGHGADYVDFSIEVDESL